MRRGWWKGILIASVGVAIVAMALRWNLLNWLVADGGTTRNVLEGLSWPAGLLALVVALAPPVRGWLKPARSATDESHHGADTFRPNPLVGRALHLIGDRLPTVAEVGLSQLGVRPAINAQSDQGLPPYVRRDIDKDLEWAIASSSLVLLHGRAAVGKSRTGAEALLRLRASDPLWIPPDGPALKELADLGLLPENMVVWLDDLERYIGHNGLNLDVLQRLCPNGAHTRTVVVATMRDEELSPYLSAATRRETAQLDQVAIDLIAQIPERCRIAVATDLSDHERQRACEFGERDERLRRAVEARQGFAEYLAAGKPMLDRWSVGDGPLFAVGQALVSAAVDCRRAGYHKPLPTTLLAELHHHYVQSGWRHRADLPSVEKGLDWAQQRVLGASSCVIPCPGDTHLAEDYLLDRAQSGQSPLPDQVNPSLWFALLDVIDGKDAYAIGYAALTRNRWDVAEVALRNAVNAGNTTEAAYGLSALLIRGKRYDEAEEVLRRGADTGNTDAIGRLATLFWSRGRHAEAVSWFRKGVTAGDTRALTGLGEVLAEMGHTEEAEEVLRRGVDAGVVPSMARLAGVLLAKGQITEAEHYFRMAANGGDVAAHVEVGKILFITDRSDEAEKFLRVAADRGDKRGLLWLVGLLLVEEREDDAAPYIRAMAAAGHEGSLTSMRHAITLITDGNVDELYAILPKILSGDAPD